MCLSHFDVSDANVACALLHVRSFMWEDIMEFARTVKLHPSWRYFREIFSRDFSAHARGKKVDFFAIILTFEFFYALMIFFWILGYFLENLDFFDFFLDFRIL